MFVNTTIKSPNHNDRPENTVIDTIVIHYTGMKTLEEAIERLCDEKTEVSSHLDEEYRAWHAGVSCWNGKDNVNDFSIGIELENKGHEFGYTPFSDAQMASLVELCKSIKTRYNIKHIVGHSDIAPTRKQDPGEFFNWKLVENL